jgi:hypothetical protein
MPFLQLLRIFPMCKFLIAAVAAFVAAIPFAASAVEINNDPPIVARGDPGTSWVALAVSPNGRVFRSESFNNEEAARRSARHECEQTSGRTCRDTMSVPDNWDVTVLRCGSRNFLGGSGQGAAYDVALGKAAAEGFSADRCRQIANY